MSTTITAALAGVFQLGGDLPVHRLGFGGMRITGPGVWGPPADRAKSIATLRRLLDLDVNLIDTAESYGPHISEELIAETLYPYPRGLVVATKGGYDRPGPDRWEINCRPERLREELEGSLRRLRLERIDLYQLHRIDPAVPEEEQFGVLQCMQREGKIRHIGLSEVSVPQIQRAQKFFAVVSVQNRYNLTDREWDTVVDHCDREGIAFIPWSPLQSVNEGQSALGRYARAALRAVKGQTAVTRIARRHRATPAQIALAWLLRRSPVMLPIPGTSQRTHLEENVGAAAIELSEQEFAAMS